MLEVFGETHGALCGGQEGWIVPEDKCKLWRARNAASTRIIVQVDKSFKLILPAYRDVMAQDKGGCVRPGGTAAKEDRICVIHHPARFSFVRTAAPWTEEERQATYVAEESGILRRTTLLPEKRNSVHGDQLESLAKLASAGKRTVTGNYGLRWRKGQVSWGHGADLSGQQVR